MFSDGVSIISSEIEANMMDVESQLMSMNVDAQLSTPVTVRSRQMAVGNHDECPSVFTPLHCGALTLVINLLERANTGSKLRGETLNGFIIIWLRSVLDTFRGPPFDSSRSRKRIYGHFS